jgi:integrase/recombinase XerD
MTEEKPHLPTLLSPQSAIALPALINRAGARAIERFVAFFVVSIRNPNTRGAYAQAVRQFMDWCEERGVKDLEQINALAIAAYIESHPASVPTVKQHLAALNSFFRWMIQGGVLQRNPAEEVKGPRLRVKTGKTPVLSTEETRQLLDSIDTSHVVGLRDRALIAAMFYSFARISAVLGLKVGDYYPNGKRYWLRLHEKGGKFHEVPVHHKAEECLDAYVEAAGIGEEKKAPLFRRAIGRTKRLSDRRLERGEAWAMIRRRVREVGIDTAVCCHTFRATGITNYLDNGGSLDKAQKIAAHSDIRTTKLYDRTGDVISLEEIERIRL